MAVVNLDLLRLRYFWLLVSLVILMILTPIVEMTELRRLPVVAIFTLVMLACIKVAGRQRRQLMVAMGLGIPWIVVTWLNLLRGDPSPGIASYSLLFALFFFTLSGLLVRIVKSEEKVDFDILCGAVSAYLLIGVTWAVSYRLIESVAPGSFQFPEGKAINFSAQFLYYSMTTLTTLGYGDVTPLSAIARVWSTLEAVTGVLYVALFVARLVAIYRR